MYYYSHIKIKIKKSAVEETDKKSKINILSMF